MSKEMVRMVGEYIDQLLKPSRGHGPGSMGILTKAFMAVSQDTPAKFTACYDSNGHPSIKHFKDHLEHITPPARIQVPLALHPKHITAMVIDIDANGKSDILFFNSLGKSDGYGNGARNTYSAQAQLFMDAVRDKFPKNKDYYVQRKFQDLSTGDNYCGDWSMWFLRNAAKTPTQPLSEIAARLERMPPSEVPKPQDLRREHIFILSQYNRHLINNPVVQAAATPSPAVIPSTKIKIHNDVEASTYIEHSLNSNQKSVDIDVCADTMSKKLLVQAFIEYNEKHPQCKLTLKGGGVSELSKEVTHENRLKQAREIITEGYKTGVVEFPNSMSREMKKLVLETFLTEFSRDPSKGTAPRFSGTGIHAINEEIKSEQRAKKPEMHTPSDEIGHTTPRGP